MMDTAGIRELKPLSGKEKFFYGFGDMSTAIVWGMTTSWVMFFLTDIFKITAMAAGTLMLVARIWDAANDPMVGLLVDRTNTKMGKARPFMLWFAIPYGLAGCFIFFTPNFGPTGRLVYAYVLYFILVLLYTLVNIPYNSMIALMTKDQKERTQLSRNRLLFASIAFMVVSQTPRFANMLGRGTDPLSVQRSGFFRVAVIFGIIAAVGFLITFFNTREHVREEKQAEEKKHTMGESLASMLKNTPWIILTIFVLVTSLSQTILSSSQIYYVKYCLGLQPTFAGTVLLMVFISMFLGIAVGPVILMKLGFKRAVVIASIIAILARILVLFLGDNYLFLIPIMLTSFSGAIPSVAIYAMYGDTVEYGEWKTGVRSEGLTFSSFTFSQKVAAGLGGFIVGAILGNLGYNPDIMAQSTRVTNGIIFIFIGIPIILSFLQILLIFFYKLDKKTYAKIVAELRERRQSNGIG